MKSYDDILRALKGIRCDRDRCFGCGWENSCSTRGCAIERAAYEAIEQLRADLTASEAARSDLAKRLAAAQQRANRLMADLKAGNSCVACVHVDAIPDCDCECLDCQITCPCSGCRDSSNFKWRGESGEATQTNGDRLRCYSDEELAEMLYQHYLSFADRGGAEDPAVQWCDMQGGCGGEGGGECTTELHKACILRWLKRKAGDDYAR